MNLNAGLFSGEGNDIGENRRQTRKSVGGAMSRTNYMACMLGNVIMKPIILNNKMQ
jgi:hypothetical protein